MKQFLDKNFLLQNETAEKLYHDYAEAMPIFDFHNHLDAKEIYENKPYKNLTEVWLYHDHYKWRAMRSCGIPEQFVTGNGDDKERYLAFVKTLQQCAGNPLYHWSHLELQRYFGISEPLTIENADEVWEKCNALLQKKEFYPRGLLEKMKVKALCTTDDPLDNLEFHKKLAKEWPEIKVLPSFRPDNVLNTDSKEYGKYISKLQTETGIEISDINKMIEALGVRLDFFKHAGCVVSDHSLEEDFYLPCNFEDANYIFNKVWMGKALRPEEKAKYKGYVLIELGKLYAKKNIVMQLHIGALRDVNPVLFRQAGKNVGCDSLQDFNYAKQLGEVLGQIHQNGGMPVTILYNLNPKDNEMLAAMAQNFNENSKGIARVQWGPAWWFNDHKEGIEQQIKIFARTNSLGNFVGMLTDSRSFLSFTRHEYFRRILCNYLGTLVEKGEFPWNEKLLGEMVKNISYNNAVKFFGEEK